MLGDVLLLTEDHWQLANKIIEIINAHPRRRTLIAISGESGSGKSELSHALARGLKALGKKAKVIHGDNFYLSHPEERSALRQKTGVAKAVGPQEWDWDSINKLTAAFRSKGTMAMPCVDLLTDQVDTLFTDFSGIQYLILDGLYAIKANGYQLRILIDIAYKQSRKAQLSRGKEKADAFREAVLEAEQLAIQALRTKANILITPNYQLLSGIPR